MEVGLGSEGKRDKGTTGRTGMRRCQNPGVFQLSVLKQVFQWQQGMLRSEANLKVREEKV